MIDFLKKSVTLAFAFTTGIFTFVPESFFKNYRWISQDYFDQYKLLSYLNAQDVNIIISRLICFLFWLDYNIIIICGFSKIPVVDNGQRSELFNQN